MLILEIYLQRAREFCHCIVCCVEKTSLLIPLSHSSFQTTFTLKTIEIRKPHWLPIACAKEPIVIYKLDPNRARSRSKVSAWHRYMAAELQMCTLNHAWTCWKRTCSLDERENIAFLLHWTCVRLLECSGCPCLEYWPSHFSRRGSVVPLQLYTAFYLYI